MTRFFLILTLAAALGGCANSSRFGRGQPVQPAIEPGGVAPLVEVEAAPLEAPGGQPGVAPPVAGGPAITPATDPYTWARVDGQRMSGNPLLMKQGQEDRQACYAASASGVNADAYVRCMRSKGYTQLTN